MIGAQPVFALRRLNGIGHVAHFAMLETAIFVGAHTQAVEDGGDAGGHDLRVMGLDRRGFVPADAGTRRIVRFQVIGVKFDQPWDQIVALHILANGRAALGNIRNPTVANKHRAGKNIVFKDDAGVREDGFLGHGIVFQLWAPASGSQE